ncbi:hypothetical protein ACIPW5_00425 [Streptomyces sp. NPDC090077]|uniref:hypothetical protein n=1 Tax=Streptomyces sp. NPDC090077 TaxID=3365938 RepID=UPI00382D035B
MGKAVAAGGIGSVLVTGCAGGWEVGERKEVIVTACSEGGGIFASAPKVTVKITNAREEPRTVRVHISSVRAYRPHLREVNADGSLGGQESVTVRPGETVEKEYSPEPTSAGNTLGCTGLNPGLDDDGPARAHGS